MLIGMPPLGKKVAAAPAGGADYIYDVTGADFDAKVMNASMEKPVIVEFWAPWCGPCKQLMPILEQSIGAKGGSIAMAKINIDESPELAQAFRVQSVPMVVAMYMGQPVTAFAGVRPQAEINKLLDQLDQVAQKNKPQALDIEAALKDAAEFLAENDLQSAQHLYSVILGENPDHAQAYVGLIRVLIAAGQPEEAQAMLSAAPEKITKDANFAAARTAVELALKAPAGDLASLKASMEANPADPAKAFDYAEACFAAGHKDETLDTMIDLIKNHRTWGDEKARKQLLRYFEAWGFADPASVNGRKRLSAVLFS
jgi:putative thioredoxin